MPLNLKPRAKDQLLQSVEYYKKKIENNEFPPIKIDVFKLFSDDIKKKYIILSLKNYKPLEESFIKELSDELKNFYEYRISNYAHFFAREIIYNNEISLYEIEDWHLKFFEYLNEEQIKIIITKIINSDEEIPKSLIEFVKKYKELLDEEEYIKFLNKQYEEFWWSDDEEELIINYDKLSEKVKSFLLGKLIQSSQIERLPIEKYINDWGIIDLKYKYEFLDYMVENENGEFFENNPNLIIGNIMDEIIEYDIIDDKEFFYKNLDDNQKKYWIQKRLDYFSYDELEEWEKRIVGLYPKYKNLQQKIKTTGEFLTDEEFKDLTNKQKQLYLQRLKNDGEELTDWEKRYLGENKETNDRLNKILIDKLNNFILYNPISNYNKIESIFYNTSLKWEISIKFEGGLEDYFTIKPFGIGNAQFKNLDFESIKNLIGILQRICKIIDLEFSKLIPVLEKEYKIHLRLNEGLGELKQNAMEGIKLKNSTLNESRTIISEDLRYHIENGLSLNQNVFRIGSESYYSLINECRTLYKKDIIELNETDKELIESDLGNSINTTHGWVYLDSPFLLEETDETLETWGRMVEAEYKGRKVSLNKPFRNTSGGKKYGVYVKNPDSGKVKLIRFGDSNMRVGTMNKDRVKSFVARHKCHEKKDKTKAGYWSCRLPQYGLVKYKGRFW